MFPVSDSDMLRNAVLALALLADSAVAEDTCPFEVLRVFQETTRNSFVSSSAQCFFIPPRGQLVFFFELIK
jgi:hypothetical protein